MTRAIRIATGLCALVLLVALLFAVPWALWHYVHWPLPHSLPRWSQLAAGLGRHSLSDRVLVDALACVVWITWAMLAISVIVEVPAAVRGRRPRRVLIAGPLQPLVGHLVAAVLVAALAVPPRSVAQSGHVPLTSSLAVVQSRQPAVAVALLSDPRRPGNAPAANGHSAITATSTDYVVEAGDTLWSIAERRLGNPLRWREIFALNDGRPEPDGQVFVDPNWIYPGWTFVLPAEVTRLPHSGEHPPAPASGRPRPEHPAAPSPGAPTTGKSRPVPVPTAPQPSSPAGAAAPGTHHKSGGAHSGGPGDESRSPASLPLAPIGLGVLSAGLLAALLQLRRVQERHRRPGRRIPLPTGDLADLEVALRSSSDPRATGIVDRAIRLFGRATAGADEAPTVLGAVLGRDRFEFLLEAPTTAPSPFTNSTPDRWSLDRNDRTVRRALLAAGEEASMLPSLVTIGEDDDGIVFLNLEAGGRIAIAGDESVATEIATAIALELSVASWVECCELYEVGVGTGQANPNRCTTLDSLTGALPVIAGHHESMARQLAGSGLSSAAGARLRSPSEQWACLVVVSNSPATKGEQCAIDRLEDPERHGIVVLVPGPSASARWQLVAQEDGTVDLPMLSRRVKAQRVPGGHLAGIGALLGLAATRADVAPDAPPYDAIDPAEVPGGDSHPEAMAPPGEQAEDCAAVEGNLQGEPKEPDASEDGAPPALGRTAATSPSDEVGRDHEVPVVSGEPRMFEEEEMLPEQAVVEPPEAISPGHLPDGRGRSQVEVNVLGQVEFRGLARKPNLSKVTELLVWLGLHRSGGSLDTIASVLSPNARHSDKTLRNYRYEARRCLGRSWLTGEQLLSEHNGLLVAREVTSDWSRFSALAKEDDLGAHHDALSLVRGRPFGEADWPWLMTEGFSSLIAAAVTDLAREVGLEEIERHDYSAALRAAEQGLLANPYDERLYRILMEAHHGDGNPAAVRATMRRLTSVVEDDVEPLESIHDETRSFYESLTSRHRSPAAESDNPQQDGNGVRRLA